MKEKSKKFLGACGILLAGTAIGVVSFKLGKSSCASSDLEQENMLLRKENEVLERSLNRASKLVNELSYHLGKRAMEKEIKL